MASSQPPTAATSPSGRSPLKMVLAIVGGLAGVALGIFAGRAAFHYLTSRSGIPSEWGLDAEESARFERAVAQAESQLAGSSRAREAFTGPDARAQGLQNAARGMRRLDERELTRWNQLRLQAARNSPAFCAAIWSGQADERTVIHGLLTLDDPSLDEWMRISAHAAVLELEAHGPAPAYGQALGTGIRRIASNMPGPARSQFLNDVEQGTRLGPNEACRTATTIMNGVSQLPPDMRLSFLRALAGVLAEAPPPGPGQFNNARGL